MPIIKFHSNKLYNKLNKETNPSPAKKEMPTWFKDASRYWFPDNTDFLSFKTCPALIDCFLSGYVLKTPCDIYISRKSLPKTWVRVCSGNCDQNNYCIECKSYNEFGSLQIFKTDTVYDDFCETRSEIIGFPKPYGFDKTLHWYPNWMPELENGYSALYTHPLNRFDLPFFTVSGIIDSDRFNTPGLMPFFLKENFEGVIPKNTPFVQIIPFKREEWDSKEIIHSMNELDKRYKKQAEDFRVPGGGAYKKKFWIRKKYD